MLRDIEVERAPPSGAAHQRFTIGSEISFAMTEFNTHKGSAWGLLLAAWMIALFATLSALFIGEVLGRVPCVLCWFQRAFMFPLAVILGVACYVSDFEAWRYGLSVAGIGWLTAFYHMLVYSGAVSESIKPCGAGPSCSAADMTILGGMPIPLLSLGAFTAIIALLIVVRRRYSQ